MIKEFFKNNPVKRILMTGERNGSNNDNDINKSDESMTTTTYYNIAINVNIFDAYKQESTNRLNYKIESMVLG